MARKTSKAAAEPKPVKSVPHVIKLPEGGQAYVQLSERLIASGKGDRMVLNKDGQKLAGHVRALALKVPDDPTGEEIRAYRHALALTQGEFAAKLNYSTISVKKWEAGEVQPSPRGVNRIRKLMDRAVQRGTILPPKF
jgi:DNA-binding transcriptional regulator YiaG